MVSASNSPVSSSSVSSSAAPADVAAVVTYVGVDVSKDSLEVAIKYDAKSFSVRNDLTGITQLLQRLPSPGACVVVIEGSGGYERGAIAELLQAGHRVALVNPRQVRQFANGLGHLAKTDPIDARVLAKFGQTVEPPCLIIPTGPQAELKQLVERRRQLVELRTAETNRQQQLSSKKTLNSVAAVLKLVNKQVKNLETQIAQLINQHDDWQQRSELIQSHPGLAEVSASTLIADLPELGQINRQRITALVGLACYNHDSGKLKGQRSIWGGRSEVRRILYMATLTAIRRCPIIKAFYKRLLKGSAETQPKLKKVALVACMRKILITLNEMIRTKTPWADRLATATATSLGD